MVEVEVGIPVRNGSGVVHDTFHAFMLSELDRYGKTTPDLFDKLNLRLAHDVCSRGCITTFRLHTILSRGSEVNDRVDSIRSHPRLSASSTYPPPTVSMKASTFPPDAAIRSSTP